MPRIFISHSSLDHDFVEREIIAFLRQGGVETWYSSDDIETAAQWHKSIMVALKSCDWFLVVLTRSVASKWVQAEVHWAVDERYGRIIPVVAEDCTWHDIHLVMRR